MGEILGIGVTHYPGLIQPDEQMAGLLNRTLNSDQVPDGAERPEDLARARCARNGRTRSPPRPSTARRLVGGFRKAREALDAFKPDFVVIFGDDQYENFREDGVPSFCVFACRRRSSSQPVRPLQRRQHQCLGRGQGHGHSRPRATTPARRTSRPS